MGLSRIGSLLHLLVAHLHGHVETTQVGDDTHAEDSDATMARHNHLGNGAHSHCVATEKAIHTILRRRFESRALDAHIDTMLEFDTLLAANLVGQRHQFVVISLVHIREARTDGVVLAAQGMLGEEVDMVRDDHQVAHMEVGIHTSRGIADEERLDLQRTHDAHRERHLLHGVALIEMETALHGHDVLASEFAKDQFSCMTLYRRDGEMGNILIGKLITVGYF